MTINEIQAEMRADGSHWWDPDTMRFFGTSVASPVYSGPGGVYFVTRDKRADDTHGYTVRRYDPASKKVETVGELAGHRSAATGKHEAFRAAEADGTCDEVRASLVAHRPVTVAEQLAADIAAHTGKTPSSADLAELAACARTVHRYREHQCNGALPCDHAQHDEMPDDCPGCDGTGVSGMALVLARARWAAQRVGARAILQGDPRGCTFKLAFPDGATNDWGREGWCVPRGLGVAS